MKYMKRRGLRMFAVAALLPIIASASSVLAQTAQTPAGKEDIATIHLVTKMVHDFLAAVPKGEQKTFDDFFAEDIIYTRSSGVTITKMERDNGAKASAAQQPAAPDPTTYDGDDFTAHPYGNMAIVNFRLIQRTMENGKEVTHYFRNTGTFLKREGKWRVVAWQATKVPEAAPAENK